MLIKRYLTLFALLSLVPFTSIAQDFNVYLGGNLQSQNIHHYTEEGVSTSFSIINDSTAVRSTFKRAINSRISYETLPGISAGINYRKKLGNRWTVLTGFGINTGKLKLKAETTSVSTTLLTTDTIPYSIPDFFQTCDDYITIGEYKEIEPLYNWVQLEIPLILRYDIAPGKWSVGVGARMSTPISISYEYQHTDFHSDVNDQGLTICTNEYKVIKDKSGNGFRDLNLGLAADMEFWFKRFGVSIGVEQRLTNIFTEIDPRQFFAIPNYSKPVYTHFRLLYKL